MKKLAFVFCLLCALMAAAVEAPNKVAAVPTFKITEFETTKSERIPKAAMFGTQVLSRTGTGLRQKKFLFVPIDIYRATLLVSDIKKFLRKDEASLALDSLSSIATVVLVLDFKDDFSASKIAAGFETALKTNNVKETKPIKQFKTVITEGGDVKKGDQISLIASNGNLSCQWANKTLEIKGDAQFIRDIFSIWLGIPADSELKTLKTSLILGK
ncbi:MAG TPA: chalcone isomerase family protein [Myxococcota bacterium]|nr:chalcone isomerase family protein [Myxococcota bacterium]